MCHFILKNLHEAVFDTVRLIIGIEIKRPRIKAAGVLGLIASWRKKEVTHDPSVCPTTPTRIAAN